MNSHRDAIHKQAGDSLCASSPSFFVKGIGFFLRGQRRRAIGTVVSPQTDQEFIAACCARAASGHTAAAPPSSVTKSRRVTFGHGAFSSGASGLPSRFAAVALSRNAY
jgi:hypothetical protein